MQGRPQSPVPPDCAREGYPQRIWICERQIMDDKTHAELRATHQALIEEFQRLQQRPFDEAAHAAYHEKLKAHAEALRKHRELLKLRTPR